jgi:hypothetical protein
MDQNLRKSGGSAPRSVATLSIARPRQYADALRQYRVLIDGAEAAKIRPGQAIDIDLPPGRHRVVAVIDWARSNPYEFDAQAGRHHRIEVGSNVAGSRLLLAAAYATIWRDRWLYLVDREGSAERKPETHVSLTLWDKPVDGPSPKTISKSELLRGLSRAAQIRALITFAAAFLSIFGMTVICAAIGVNPDSLGSAAAVLCVFGIPGLVCWIWTVKVCRNSVRCPFCANSLWSCGTGNFKARRMRLRKDTNACPHCDIQFS